MADGEYLVCCVKFGLWAVCGLLLIAFTDWCGKDDQIFDLLAVADGFYRLVGFLFTRTLPDRENSVAGLASVCLLLSVGTLMLI